LARPVVYKALEWLKMWKRKDSKVALENGKKKRDFSGLDPRAV
jgi:hypothetical protein